MSRLRDCQLCPRLNDFRQQLAIEHKHYHNRPVAAFGAARSRLLIVGLAPGLHGANASGRPFTGDASGTVLFKMLNHYGYASSDTSRSKRDGMKLVGCRITNAVKCVPPQNKPLTAEINQCNPYLKNEISQLPYGAIILALGSIAHRAVLKARSLAPAKFAFAHLAEFELGEGLQLIDSYHCSRYNLNTGRLSLPMFDAVFQRIGHLTR